MAIIITNECINCGACEPECPNTAIYEPGVNWTWAGGTALKKVEKNGKIIEGTEPQEPVSQDFYFIVSDKCTECAGFHDEPQCASVCPVDCCILDVDHVEDKETLLEKKAFLHQE